MGLETLEQQSQATTPTFSGAPVPGIPAPGSPAGAQTSQDPNSKAQQLIAWLKQQATRKQAANTAVPSAIPAQRDPNAARQIGMNTANPHAWSGVRLGAEIGTNIRNAVAQRKENQILKAEGDWNQLQSALNEKYTAEQSGDPKAIQAAEAKLHVILTDEKKLKNMAKALNQDWLNPDKTTPHGEALKRMMNEQKQKDAQNQKKQGAAQNLKDAFKKILGQKQKLQMTLDEKEKMAREIESKAPTTEADPKTMIELAKVLGEDAFHKDELAMRQKQLDTENKRLDLEEKQRQDALKEKHDEHVDNLEMRKTQLSAQIQEKTDALAEKKLEGADRKYMQEQLMDLRRDALAQSRELAEEKLGTAGTPKERQTWVNNELKELMKARDEAQKSQHLWGMIGGDEYQNASDRVMRLQAMSDDIIKGKTPTNDAISKIYGEQQSAPRIPPRPPNVPANYEYVEQGPNGKPGWMKPKPAAGPPR